MRKVTIGCKGDSGLKWELKEEAEEAGMSLSEYIETILENRHMKDDVRALRLKIRETKQENDLILNKLDSYENRLEPVFKEYAGKELPYRRRDGEMAKKHVQTHIDLLDCILSSINQNHE